MTSSLVSWKQRADKAIVIYTWSDIVFHPTIFYCLSFQGHGWVEANYRWLKARFFSYRHIFWFTKFWALHHRDNANSTQNGLSQDSNPQPKLTMRRWCWPHAPPACFLFDYVNCTGLTLLQQAFQPSVCPGDRTLHPALVLCCPSASDYRQSPVYLDT